MITNKKNKTIMSIERKTWEEFRQTGLLVFINSILHIFGWCIVLMKEDGKMTGCFPARTKYRGFAPGDYDEAYKKLSNYMADNANELKKEAEE